MNKGSRIFSRPRVKAFFQDMLTYEEKDIEPIADLLKALHWHYAAKVLEATQVVAGTPGLYPVFVTSFKCAPIPASSTTSSGSARAPQALPRAAAGRS